MLGKRAGAGAGIGCGDGTGGPMGPGYGPGDGYGPGAGTGQGPWIVLQGPCPDFDAGPPPPLDIGTMSGMLLGGATEPEVLQWQTGGCALLQWQTAVGGTIGGGMLAAAGDGGPKIHEPSIVEVLPPGEDGNDAAGEAASSFGGGAAKVRPTDSSSCCATFSGHFGKQVL